MRTRIALLAVWLTLPLAAAPAHDIVHKGTVVSADAKALRVSVPDDNTKKPVTMTFDHDRDTTILRGEKVVSFAEARIQKGEPVAVTINHDDDPTFALVIRLDARK
jgi:hypothetical protein